MSDGETEQEQDMQYLAEELTRNCTEYVEISKSVDKLKAQIKQLTNRQKELSTKITQLMKVSEVEEINCGPEHKIMLQERKSTTSFKLENIGSILADTLEINQEQLTQILEQIKGTRVTTFKDTIKLKAR